MAHLSSFNPSFNPLDKARRHHRLKKGRPLVAGAGEVIANGKLRVELPTVDGDIVTYIASPDMVWRFLLDTSVRPKVRVLEPEEAEEPLTIEEEAEAAALAEEALQSLLPTTPADRIKRAIDAARALDAALNEFVKNRARAATPATSPVAPQF
jgi:hypothetical protein